MDFVFLSQLQLGLNLLSVLDSTLNNQQRSFSLRFTTLRVKGSSFLFGKEGRRKNMMLGGLVELIAIRIDLPKEVQLLSMTFLIVVNNKKKKN